MIDPNQRLPVFVRSIDHFRIGDDDPLTPNAHAIMRFAVNDRRIPIGVGYG